MKQTSKQKNPKTKTKAIDWLNTILVLLETAQLNSRCYIKNTFLDNLLWKPTYEFSHCSSMFFVILRDESAEQKQLIYIIEVN